jgi:cytochrome c553
VSSRVARSAVALAALALLAARAEPPPDREADAALRARLAACAACHGESGNSASAGVPSLAGQPRTFLEVQMVLFRERVRASEVMQPLAAGLSDAEIGAIAAHYAGQATQPAASAAPDPALAARGKQLSETLRCATCHLEDFQGQEQIPRLAGQREDYLGAALLAYRDQRRTGTDGAMNEVMTGVGDADIRALASFLAGLR